MKSDWLLKLIIDTKLIGNASLLGKEYLVMMAYLKNGKSATEIAQEIGLSGERVRQIIDKAFEKLLFTIMDSMAKATLIQTTLAENDALKKELIQLKTKFKKQLADDQQLKFDFTQPNVSTDKMRFSVRAENALDHLGITSLKDLSNLTRQILYSKKGVGAKTVEEIIRKAEEYGVKIK